MKEKLILDIKFGGLGDHLFYSHIPHIAKETGAYTKVYISNLSEFRSPEYRRLIWEKNPFVDGFTDEPGTPFIRDISEFEKDPVHYNILDTLMYMLGLDDGKRFHDPELYYEPRPRTDVADADLYDPNYVSNVGEFSPADLARCMQKLGLTANAQMALRERSIPLPIGRIVTSNSLEDFFDIVHSCKTLCCLTSGTATLAAALGKPAVAFYGTGQSRRFHHSKLHRYVHVPQRPVARSRRALKSCFARLRERLQ